jgi:hypothetical protein
MLDKVQHETSRILIEVYGTGQKVGQVSADLRAFIADAVSPSRIAASANVLLDDLVAQLHTSLNRVVVRQLGVDSFA